MPRNFTTGYNIFFAAVICVFWSILVSASAVTLRERQEANVQFDQQRNIMFATGLISRDDDLSREQIVEKYKEKIRPYVITLKNGGVQKDIAPEKFDQRMATSDVKQSVEAPPNAAKILRIPNNGLVYHVVSGDKVDSIVVPIEGKGLWGTIYGYLALGADTTTIRGIAFYKHKETPGLGAEIENPSWTVKLIGRKALNEKFEPIFALVKGSAGSIKEDPYHVDGLSGATLTGNGVTALIQFWLGDSGYGPYLTQFRQGER
ncbi:MAG: Na(+)-translocating NADH-quinone reductase subunit C [Proteobacteria bacterium]|nr:Na(+)-translocating NADH-quinone reductase subunit C [Pseudomonadota bacterium]